MQIDTIHECKLNTAYAPFLAGDQLSHWVRDLYAHAMGLDPVEASTNADMLAQAMADRLPSIYFDEPLFSSAADRVDEPSSSLWLVWALMQARSRDPFIAGSKAQALAVALGARTGRAAALPYSHAMATLRPRLLQAVLENGN